MGKRRRPEHRPLTISASHWRQDGRPKVRYSTRRDAASAAAERADEIGVELTTYQCDFCQGWHMGGLSRPDD